MYIVLTSSKGTEIVYLTKKELVKKIIWKVSAITKNVNQVNI